MTSSVVVITRDQDVTADLVCAELVTRAVPVVRLDLADFPQRLTQVSYLLNGRAHWTGALVGRYRDVNLEAVRSVWYRKPSRFRFDEQMTPTEQQWAAAEASNGFGGVLAALPTPRWCNHPHRSAAAELKPAQMSVAAGAGLSVPDALLTNDPNHARDFCRSHRAEGVVYKPLRGGPASENGRHVALRTVAVSAEDITDDVRHTAHLFQARVDVAYPVRVTVVGHRVFAVRIDTTGATPALDWRDVPDTHSTYTPIDAPDAVVDGLHRVMAAFGLVYAAPDFLVDRDGRWWFIGDLNPNGQWGWIAGHTGLPIASAIADELTRETST